VQDLPYARGLHTAELEWLRLGAPGRLTDLQFAARWYWLNLVGFGGQLTGGFGTAATQPRVSRTRRRIQSIKVASQRLLNVLVECEDYRVLIPRYDTIDTLFYCDPPYIGTEGCYSGVANFVEHDHADLADMLNSVKGKAAISYAAHPLIEKLYPAKRWYRVSRRRSVTLGNSHRGTRAKQITEVLLMNYDFRTETPRT
jgi:DNA adenine methylase